MSKKISPVPTVLSIHRLSSIPPQPLQWLWPRYLPKGKLSLLIGDPASGKTALTLDLAARLSTFSPMPPHPLTPHAPSPSATAEGDNPPPPAYPPSDPDPTSANQDTSNPLTTDHSSLTTSSNPDPSDPLETTPSPLPPTPFSTLLLSPEDNAADTLRPRLDALGANGDHIRLLPDLHSLTSDGHLDALTQIIEDIPDLALLVIDPITYYLGQTDRVLQHPDAYTARSILHSLAQLAANFNIAVLLTSRLAKRIPATNSNAPNLSPYHLHRALGTLASSSIARTIHLLTPYTPAPDQSPPTTPSPLTPPPTHLLIPLKSNATHLPPPLAFSLSNTLTWHPDPLDLTELSTPPDPVLEQTADFLRLVLADGPKHAREIQNIADLNIISRSSLYRAKTFLKIKPIRVGLQGPYHWALPGDTRKPPASSTSHLPDDPTALAQLVKGLARK